jgi:hypothetical protein
LTSQPRGRFPPPGRPTAHGWRRPAPCRPGHPADNDDVENLLGHPGQRGLPLQRSKPRTDRWLPAHLHHLDYRLVNDPSRWVSWATRSHLGGCRAPASRSNSTPSSGPQREADDRPPTAAQLEGDSPPIGSFLACSHSRSTSGSCSENTSGIGSSSSACTGSLFSWSISAFHPSFRRGFDC